MPLLISELDKENVKLDRLGTTLSQISGIIGIVFLLLSFLICLFFQSMREQFYFSYLTNYSFFLSLSLGALFFVALQHLTHSGWSVVVRRLSEFIAANIPILAILFLPLIFGMGYLYEWTHSEAVAHDPLLQTKKPYLNIPFFLFRMVLYFAVWWVLSWFFLNRSLKQDESGDKNQTLHLEKASAIGMILFGFTITFASIDLLMSLAPHWYSTMFGVYYFSGSLLGFLAFFTIITFLLQRKGILAKAITREHYHDLGKLIFAFVFFWGYIAFSQYMLIWYSNLPEETVWILRRQEGQWFWLSMLLIFGHFLIPFLGLISRTPKRRKRILVIWAAWILIMHWFDIYWIVMPEFTQETIPFHLLDITCFLGIGGLYLAALTYIARGRSLLAIKDPRLEESLLFENA